LVVSGADTTSVAENAPVAFGTAVADKSAVSWDQMIGGMGAVA
jgi:hypothetical protein